MKIPNKIMEEWEELKDHGDITDMANGDENLRVYISNAFTKKKCSEKVFRTISEFYNKRRKLLKTA